MIRNVQVEFEAPSPYLLAIQVPREDRTASCLCASFNDRASKRSSNTHRSFQTNYNPSSCPVPMYNSRQCGVGSGSGSPVIMNSAGSCDSMISINSGYSDDSMEHLSPEERACLMFLEETIESLEVEDDSGLSNDEPELPFPAGRSVHPSSLTEPLDHDDPNRILRKDNKLKSVLVPTPLVIANGSASLVKKPVLLSSRPNSPAVKSTTFMASGPPKSPSSPGAAPSPDVRMRVRAETTTRLNFHSERPESNDRPVSLPPSFIPEPPNKSAVSTVAKTQEGPKIERQRSTASQLVMELLPPPSAFMDEPRLRSTVNPLPPGPSQPQAQLSQFQKQSLPQGIRIPPRSSFGTHDGNSSISPTTSSPRMLTPSSLEDMRKKASMKRVPERVPVPEVRPPSQKVSNQASFLASASALDPRSTCTVDSGEPKSPPAVAPKPKKLPSSIVLKNHKDAAPSHSLVSPSDRGMINPQKVHTEALMKLGLLKTDETDSALSRSTSYRVPPQNSFIAGTHALPAEPFPALRTDSPPKVGARDNLLIARSPSQRPFQVKSATLERPPTDQKSLTLERSNPSQEGSLETSDKDLQPGELRKNRSRPASAGSWKDFGIDQLPSELNREPEIRRSRNSLLVHPPTQMSMESQKALRSHGISVHISPQNNKQDNHKQALKRLGLMKD